MNRLLKIKMHARHQKRAQKTAERRRGVLIKNLKEQLNLLHAAIDGKPYISVRKVWRTNESGQRIQIERPKRMRSWFWVSWSGVCFFQVWYGSKIVELQPGMTVVEAESKENLVEVIRSIMEAVKHGNLDVAIEDVAKKGMAELRGRSNPIATKKLR